ncbi:hypothetical protein [Methylomonas sp. CM2]|uniref:hypothetical protein n=1 Tax=Methylomonas sp. CM2 TaxID=3417647 RepID=UPI003CF999DA
MDSLKLNQFQSYFDEQTGDKLTLWFGQHVFTVDGILVSLNNVPLLRNENTGEVHLPDKTKHMIKYFVEEAKKHKKPGIFLTPKALDTKRYNFADKFDFIYSQIDYEYIPGLMRSWNEGFLTPVFFNLSVLNKYSQNPDYTLDLFSETYGSIWRGQDWHIAFGINKNNKVIMWLGDIDSLPDSEKYYLRSENLPSDHDIHSEFYEAQIDVQWSEASKQSTLFHLRKSLNDAVRQSINFDLYMLEGEVSKVISNLHRPVFWEDKHVGPVIESFNRIFVESLNSKAIKDDIKSISASADIKNKGSLKLFELWIELRQKLANTKDIACPFYVLYDFRIITCHLQSEESKFDTLKSINSRLGLTEDNTSYEIIYDALISSLSNSYRTMIDSNI